MDLTTALVAAYFIAAMVASVACAVIASRQAGKKGRRRWLWGTLGLLFGVLAIVALARLRPAQGSQLTVV